MRLALLLPGALMLIIGLLMKSGFGAWNYLAVTLMLLSAIPSGGGTPSEKSRHPVTAPPNKTAVLLLTAAMLLSAVFSGWMGIREPLLMSQERMAVQGNTELTAPGESVILIPDWIWTGSFTVQLSGFPGTEATLRIGNETRTLTLDESGHTGTEMPVTSPQSCAVITLTEGEQAELTDWHAVSHIHWPKLFTFLFALWGTEAALYCLWKKRLGKAAFWLALGLSASMVMARVITVPHGWDEPIHRNYTM